MNVLKHIRNLLKLDQGALRSSLFLLIMFGVVGVLIFSSRNFLFADDMTLGVLLGPIRDSHWGLPVTILIFLCFSLLGVPQWVLIGASVATFDPLTGGFYAWLSTLIAASSHFWFGRKFGARHMKSISRGFVERLVKILQGNAFVTSFVVRLVPTGPFILVNLAAGVASMRYRAFVLGTALGIIPKILIVVLLGQGLLSATQSKTYMAMFVFAALMMLGIMLLSRRYLRRHYAE